MARWEESAKVLEEALQVTYTYNKLTKIKVHVFETREGWPQMPKAIDRFIHHYRLSFSFQLNLRRDGSRILHCVVNWLIL